MVLLEASVVDPNFAFEATAFGFLATGCTSQLCWPALHEVVHPVKSDLCWDTLVQRYVASGTARSCTGSSGKVDSDNSPADGEKVQRVVLRCLCGSVQMPSLLDAQVQTVSEEGPPPFLGAYGNPVFVNILICAVHTAHGLVVMPGKEGLWDLHLF